MIYNDYDTSFEGLLERDNSFTVHENNVKRLLIELYKVENGLSSQIFSNIFKKKW